jgi:CheY-like chemotaxis protein
MPTRVLVVDDSPTIRKVVSGVLERHGYAAVHAADGQAALEKLLQAADAPREDDSGESDKIDVVLVDFVMPRMNGFQLCRAIRNNDMLRTTPVVLMSAKSDRIRDHFVQQTGAIDAISKPFEEQALIAVIENAIRRAEEWRAREDVNGKRAGSPDDFDPNEPSRPGVGDAKPLVALSGDISVIPIGAVLQLLQIEARSGVLVVTDGKTDVTLIVRKGLIDLVHARGAGSEFRLGRYFVERGLVTPGEIDRLLREHAPASGAPRPPHGPPESGARTASARDEAPRKLLGDLLVQTGRITAEQLREGLARQSSELVYEILRWPSGRFEFRRDDTAAAAAAVQLGLPVASVVMEGFRRVDEWRVVEAGLGSFESVLHADRMAIDAAQVDRLAKPEQKLLEMVDGERTVHEIIEQSHMSSFDACKILYQLLEARLVRRRAT